MEQEANELDALIGQLAEGLARLPLEGQRKLLLRLLQELDRREAQPDHFNGMLLSLAADIRQRATLMRW